MMRGKNQRGAVNLIVVVLMLLVVGAGIALAASMVTTSVGDAVLEDDSGAALYLAESGLEAAVGNYNATGTCSNAGVGTVANVAFGRGAYTIQSAAVVGALCRIVVLGAIGNVVRTIQADVAPSTTVGINLPTTQATSNNNVAVAHSSTGTDRLLLVAIARRTSTPLPAAGSVTYNRVALQLAAVRLRTASGANVRSEIWVLPNPPLGSYSLQVQSSDRLVVHAGTFTGVDQVIPIPAAATACNDGASNTARVDITTVRRGSWLVDSLATQPAGRVTAALGQAGASAQSPGGPNGVLGGASFRVVPVTGASFMEWTFSSRGWAHCGVVVQPTQGGIVNWTEL